LLCLTGGIAYAVTTFGPFFGGTVTVVEVTINIEYSTENATDATWSSTLNNIPANQSWYARFVVAEDGYSGTVEITWTLQTKVGGSWVDTATSVTTLVSLSGSQGQIVYASPDGSITNNYDWGVNCNSAGEYRIKVVITE